MTPGARISAAIEVLDDMGGGMAAEQALTRWARRSRFAGSKDRAAVRDHVFDVLRCRRTAAYLGGGTTGRALMIGLLRHQTIDPVPLFDGAGHAPAPLEEAERTAPAPPGDTATVWNLPDWLIALFTASLGDKAEDAALVLQSRAPVCLRVNTARSDIATATARLAEEGITTELNPLAPTALTVTDGSRKIRNCATYLDGWVELQDAASQAVVAALPADGRVLDYCAGGGGKALALAMDPARTVFAYDKDPRRMTDLSARAQRAGASITVLDNENLKDHAAFDTVLCDVPCSGSGAWRRAAEGKWLLTAEQLSALNRVQDDILDIAADLTAPGGTLAYATCSLFSVENEDRIAAFLARQPGWNCRFSKRFDVNEAGDGFFTAHLTRY